jgi:hypothetical protein
MEKKELKAAKKEYKRVRLFQELEKVDMLARELRQELGDVAWAEFEVEVDGFLKEVKALADEVEAKARDLHDILVEQALQPYLERAKALGGGAQKYIRDVFDRAVAERDAIRAAQPKPQLSPTEKIYPCLPPDWLPRFYFKDGQIPADKRLGVEMNDYCFVSLWQDCEQKTERLRKLNEQTRATAGSSEQFDDVMGTAQCWLEVAVPVAREAEKRLEDTQEEKEIIQKLGEPLIGYIKRFRKRKAANEASRAARSAHIVSIKGVENVVVQQSADMNFPADGAIADDRAMRTLSTHPNDITTLRPGDAWTVYIDESYRGGDEAFETGGVGIMAGVICRDDVPLPLLPDLHCSQNYSPEELTAQDNALEEILHHPNCGVLAIPSSAYEVSMGWDDALASWVDVLVRLLPFPEGDGVVSLRVCVEPHDPYRTIEDFRMLKLVCEKSLKNFFPERARRVNLSFEPLPKPGAGERSGNAYPDIIGFTCLRHSGDNTARQRYKASGWSGVCHLNVSPDRISRLLRCFYRSEPLDAATWSPLVSSDGIGIMGALSARFGERAKASPEEWERYMGFLCAHLTSGTIDMKLLRKQVAWLRTYQPPAIAKKSQLAWLTAQIALANHEGKLAAGAGSPLRAEFDALCEQLYDEAAPLVCEATLNLAVAYTNGYEFEMALALIQSLLGKDRATVGLSGYGKLLSTAGQHFAFLGMADEAISKFNEALSCFSRLTDEKERSINLDITRAYLATATMDGRPADARRVLALYLLGDERAPEEALLREVACLAGERKAKFHHYILLRYIAAQPDGDPLRSAYVGAHGKWCSPSAGHPWELIEFYRAQLLPVGEERARRLDTAWRLAVVEGGETLMVIAAVIAGAALADGLEGEWPARFERAVAQIGEMPGLRENGRYQALLDQPTAKLPPLEFAAKVLPFNFR